MICKYKCWNDNAVTWLSMHTAELKPPTIVDCTVDKLATATNVHPQKYQNNNHNNNDNISKDNLFYSSSLQWLAQNQNAKKKGSNKKIALCTKGLKKKVSIVEQKSRIACLAREHYFNPWKPTLPSRYAEKKKIIIKAYCELFFTLILCACDYGFLRDSPELEGRNCTKWTENF